MSELNEIKKLAESYLHGVDLEPLEKAYLFAAKVHADQIHPTSGEPYIDHLLSVAEILLTMKLDLQTVISGLLHGVLKQDPSLSIKEVEAQFGKDVAVIVEGYSRLSDIQTEKISVNSDNFFLVSELIGLYFPTFFLENFILK